MCVCGGGGGGEVRLALSENGCWGRRNFHGHGTVMMCHVKPVIQPPVIAARPCLK